MRKQESVCNFEYTAAQTPHQNFHAETSFTVIAAKTRAMMGGVNISKEMKYLLMGEAAKRLVSWIG